MSVHYHVIQILVMLEYPLKMIHFDFLWTVQEQWLAQVDVSNLQKHKLFGPSANSLDRTQCGCISCNTMKLKHCLETKETFWFQLKLVWKWHLFCSTSICLNFLSSFLCFESKNEKKAKWNRADVIRLHFLKIQNRNYTIPCLFAVVVVIRHTKWIIPNKLDGH